MTKATAERGISQDATSGDGGEGARDSGDITGGDGRGAGCGVERISGAAGAGHLCSDDLARSAQKGATSKIIQAQEQGKGAEAGIQPSDVGATNVPRWGNVTTSQVTLAGRAT